MRIGVLAVTAAMGLAGMAAADELTLTNGDRLRGAITAADAERLTFTHALGTALVFPWAQVRTLGSDGEQIVRLKDGTLLRGTLRPLAEGEGFGLTTTALGDLPLVRLPDLAGFGPPPTAAWSGALSLGLAVQDGNTRARTGSVLFAAQRKSEWDLIEARAGYHYGDTRGFLTTRNGHVALQYNLDVLAPGYAYARGAAEYDRFQFLNLRTRGGVGLGVAWIDRDWLSFRTEGGVEYVNEDLRGQPDRDFPAARAAVIASWTVVAGVRLREFAELVPNLERGRDFVFRSETALDLALGRGFALGLAVIVLYDEIPPLAARHRTDTIATLTLTYTL